MPKPVSYIYPCIGLFKIFLLRTYNRWHEMIWSYNQDEKGATNKRKEKYEDQYDLFVQWEESIRIDLCSYRRDEFCISIISPIEKQNPLSARSFFPDQTMKQWIAWRTRRTNFLLGCTLNWWVGIWPIGAIFTYSPHVCVHKFRLVHKL